MAFPLPDKPSIAVLPFVDLSVDANNAALADGITEDILTALSKLKNLFVMSRTSTLAYKGQDVSIKQVAEDLGVRYVLEGSIQRDGDEMRVTAQLINAITGEHVWADRFDRDVTDLFDVKDEIALSVATSIGGEIAQGERTRATRRETNSLEAWMLWHEAQPGFQNLVPEGVLPAREMFQRAVEIDPGFVSAWVALSATYRFEGQFWPGDFDRENLFAQAEELLDRAFAIDPENAYAFASLAGLDIARGDLDRAIEDSSRAIALRPNDWVARGLSGWALNQHGRFDEAIRDLGLAMRQNPAYPNWVLSFWGKANAGVGQYDEARSAFEAILAGQPTAFDEFMADVWLAAIDLLDGDDESAEARIAAAMAAWPNSTIKAATTGGYKDPSDVAEILAAWRRLGLPE